MDLGIAYRAVADREDQGEGRLDRVNRDPIAEIVPREPAGRERGPGRPRAGTGPRH